VNTFFTQQVSAHYAHVRESLSWLGTLGLKPVEDLRKACDEWIIVAHKSAFLDRGELKFNTGVACGLIVGIEAPSGKDERCRHPDA
jgi:hypothetical protein